MRKLVLVFGILASVVSVSMGAMSDEEWQRASIIALKMRIKARVKHL